MAKISKFSKENSQSVCVLSLKSTLKLDMHKLNAVIDGVFAPLVLLLVLYWQLTWYYTGNAHNLNQNATKTFIRTETLRKHKNVCYHRVVSF